LHGLQIKSRMQGNSPKYDLHNTAIHAVRGEIAFKGANPGVSDKDIQTYLRLKELEKANSTQFNSLISEYNKRNAVSHSFADYFHSHIAADTLSASKGNYAFIDEQNLYKEIKSGGWKINWKAFRKYLSENGVTKAFVFMGYLKENESIYYALERAGFKVILREVRKDEKGKVDGGNVDADVAFFAGYHSTEYDKAIIVGDDGDYTLTLSTLYEAGNLEFLLSSHSVEATSEFIQNKIPLGSIKSLNSIRDIIEHKKLIQQ
jgi:hypothetical protein